MMPSPITWFTVPPAPCTASIIRSMTPSRTCRASSRSRRASNSIDAPGAVAARRGAGGGGPRRGRVRAAGPAGGLPGERLVHAPEHPLRLLPLLEVVEGAEPHGLLRGLPPGMGRQQDHVRVGTSGA